MTNPAATLQRKQPPKGLISRSFAVKRDAVNAEDRTVPLAFSSELPVSRYFGVEILSHEAGAMRMDRLNNRAAVLENHDLDRQVGVVESATLDTDKIGRAVVRFGRSPAADAVFQDVLDGIRTHVSVAYELHKWEVTEGEKGSPDVYRFTDWEPYEISIVSVPADPSVGIGRGMPETTHATLARSFGIQLQDQAAAADELTPALPSPASVTPQPKQTTTQESTRTMETPTLTPEQQRAKFASDCGAIIQLGARFASTGGPRIAAAFLQEGKSDPVEFQRHLFDKLSGTAADVDPLTHLGMERKEVQRFSMVRAINAMVNPQDKNAVEAAAFEREASEAVAKKLGRAAKGFFVPMDVQKRDLLVGTPTAGGNTVQTTVAAANFIDLLRNAMMTRKMGAQVLTGLIGMLAIPKQTGAGTAYWVAENGAPTEGQQVIGQVPMSPKTVGAFTDISRRLLLQSSISVDSFVQTDLAKVLGLAIDLAGIAGTGTGNQPTGILNTAGIGSVAGGANGLAATWPNITKLWGLVSGANADFGSTGFLTNSKAIGSMMAIEKAAASAAQFIVPSFPNAEGVTSIGGAKCGVSNQVPSNLVKGTSGAACSALIYGNFAAQVYGEWGALDLMVDPYSQSTSGTVRVVALQDVDVVLRYVEAFAAIQDLLTP